VSTVIVAASLIVFAFLQATVFPSASFVSVMPDITMVIVLIWTAVRGVREGLVWAFAIGVLLDTLALDPLGANALALLPAVMLGALGGQRFFHSGLIVPVVSAVIATLLHATLLLLVRSAGGESLAFEAVGRVVFFQAILNAIVVPPIYLFASFAQRPMASRYA
jgi:rod shape-determining protein MreD